MSNRIVRKSASSGPDSPHVWGLYDPGTGSIQYVCADPSTRQAAVIDVVRDFDPAEARLHDAAMEQVLALVAEEGLEVVWILDTHPHADHVMASAELKRRIGAPNAIGARTREIAELWRGFYNLPDTFDVDGSFDRLLSEGDTLALGNLTLEVMFSPGHTLGSISFVCGDAAFVHDTLMQTDVGSTRADFPGGSASELWDSIQAILALPAETRLFVGHDYGTKQRDTPAWEATVSEHRAHNPHVKDGTTRAQFIETREARDASLGLPARMLAALQLNLRAGDPPPPEDDGASYLKIPLGKF